MDDPTKALEPLRDGEGLTVYAIYDRPRDAPEFIVVRPFDVLRGRAEPVPRAAHARFRTIDDARRFLRVWGLRQVERSPEDDSRIIESWL